jgi:RNA polymerase sigma factor (sigma-70 family)
LDASPSLRQGWTLTAEAFDALLFWLDPDREKAGEKYEVIRSGLIRGFRKHGCNLPEDLADETINRVARKLPEIAPTYVGDPARYFYGVAHNIHLEYLRRQPQFRPLSPIEQPPRDIPSPDALDDIGAEYDCLTRCMHQLTPRAREMILLYYQGERQVKIKLRKQLAEKLGIKLTNLRLQAQRVRMNLKRCILLCLE